MDSQAEPKSEQFVNTNTVRGKCTVPYSVIILCAASYLTVISQSITYTIGTLFVDWTQTFESSKSQTASAISLGQGLSLIVGPVVAMVCGMVGNRVMVFSGGLLAALGMATSALCNNISQLYITYGVISGIGFAMIMTPAYNIVGDHFTKHRPLALAVISAVSGVWVFIFPYLFRAAGDTLGWRGAHFVIASLVVQSCVMGALLRPVARETVTSHDQSSDKIITSSSTRWWQMLSLCKNPKLALLVPGLFFITFGGNTLPAIIVDYAVGIGLSKKDGAELLSVIGAGGLFGRLLVLPLLTTRWLRGRSSQLFVTGGLIRSLGIALCASTEEFVALAFGCFIFGSGLGMQLSSLAAMIIELFGFTDKLYYIGFGFGSIGLGTLLGAPITGAIVDATDSYRLPLYLNAAMCFAGSMLLLATVCLSKRKQSFKHKYEVSVFVIKTNQVTEVTKL